MSAIDSTRSLLSSGKEKIMPKKCTLPENDVRDSFIVLYEVDGRKYQQEYVGLKNAVTGYRQMRSMYGDITRMARVILNYGTEI